MALQRSVPSMATAFLIMVLATPAAMSASPAVATASGVVPGAASVAVIPPPPASVAIGADHACAIVNGGVRCWGANAHGQLGDGTTTPSSPVAVLVAPGGAPLTDVAGIAVGTDFTCALLASGHVSCWGLGVSGQLGNGSLADRQSPTAVSGISTATAIAAGTGFACALLASGTVTCWGVNASGQLGDGTTTKRTKPVAAKSIKNATALVAGANHACALVGGGVRCWGANASGQLGDGTTNKRTKAITVKSVTGAISLAAGSAHTCAGLSNGTAMCWGLNSSGQLGDGTTKRRLTPVTVKSLTGAMMVTAGSAHTCALLSGDTALCWGANSGGQLGDGTKTNRSKPVAVHGLTDVAGLAAGGSSSCADAADQSVRCWGANGSGQLGDGTSIGRRVPTAVVGLVPVSVVAILDSPTLRDDGASTTTLSAIVHDAAGTPVAGVDVTFGKDADDDVTLGASHAWTDETGVASVSVTASTTAGPNTLSVTLTGTALVATASLEEIAHGTVTLSAAPGGTISPSGTADYAIGTELPISVTPDDPALIPSLIVDGAAVALTPPGGSGTASTYTLAVSGIHDVQATFAEPSDHLVVLDAAAGALFVRVADGGTSVTFSGKTPLLDSLVVGDIVAAGLDSGMPPMLLKITSIDRSGAGTVLMTQPADLTDAFTSASADLELPVTQAAPTEPASASHSPTGVRPAFGGSASVTIAGWSKTVEASVGPIAATGQVSLSGPTIGVAIDIGLGGVHTFSARLTESASASITLSAWASYTLSKEWTLAEESFNATVMLGPVPVPVVLKLQAGLGVDITVAAGVTTSASWSGSITTGVQYVSGSGWSPINEQSSTFTYTPPTLAAGATIRAYPFFTAIPAVGFSYGPELELFCGPYLKIEPGYLELHADIAANPWWTLDAGVELSGGATCSFGDPWQLGAVDLANERVADAGGPFVNGRGDWPQFHDDPAHSGDNSSEKILSAANVSDLRVAWTDTADSYVLSSPAVAGGVVYIGSTDGKLYAYAVGCASGGGSCTPLWTGKTGNQITSSPAVADGVVYVGSEDGKLYAFAVDCASGGGSCTPLWTGTTGSTFGSSPAVADGVVYVGSSNGKLYAFAVGCARGGRSCTPLWTGATGAGSYFESSPAVADGVVYVGSEDHELYAFAVGCASGGGSCTPLWTGATGYDVQSSPAVADGVVYVGSADGNLYAFAVGCASGGGSCTPLWTGATGDEVFSSPAVADGVVYVGSMDGKLYAFAVGCASGGGSCTPLWTGTAGDEIQSSPAVAGGVVYVGSYVGSYDGKLSAFAVGCASGGGTCTPLWTGAGGGIFSSPAVADGVVYVGSYDGKLYAFDRGGH